MFLKIQKQPSITLVNTLRLFGSLSVESEANARKRKAWRNIHRFDWELPSVFPQTPKANGIVQIMQIKVKTKKIGEREYKTHTGRQEEGRYLLFYAH